jgi:hypothetical protein
VIFAAGAWAAVLLLWRVFDRPDVDRAVNVGIQWGFFFAFIAAGVLAAAGWRIRSRDVPSRRTRRPRRPTRPRRGPSSPTASS